jgi:hypothetical protein
MSRPGRAAVAGPRADEGDLVDQQQPPATKPRSRIRLIIQAVFSLALVGVLFYYLLKDVDLAQVWARSRR